MKKHIFIGQKFVSSKILFFINLFNMSGSLKQIMILNSKIISDD